MNTDSSCYTEYSSSESNESEYKNNQQISGIDAEYTDSEEEIYQAKSNKKSNWSPTETLHVMTKNNNQVDLDVFQVFIKEMLRDKCWNKKDMEDFHDILKTVMTMMMSAKTDDELISVILNPKFYNAIHALLDKLDTMNAVCVLSTNNKCDMIKDPFIREKMKKQVQIMTKLIDIYTPVFIRLILMDENFAKKLSDEKTCDFDPYYLETYKNVKSKLIGSLYMRKLADKSYEEQNQILKNMSNKTSPLIIKNPPKSIVHVDSDVSNSIMSSDDTHVLSDNDDITSYQSMNFKNKKNNEEMFRCTGRNNGCKCGCRVTRSPRYFDDSNDVVSDYTLNFLILLIIVIIVGLIIFLLNNKN